MRRGDYYYPFGLSFNSYQRSGEKANDFLYNSFEIQNELDLGWYDYQARYFDPVIARFLNVDPAADLMRRHSPYNYGFDNPIRFTDPDGMVPEESTNCPEGSNCTEKQVSDPRDGQATMVMKSTIVVQASRIDDTDYFSDEFVGHNGPSLLTVVKRAINKFRNKETKEEGFIEMEQEGVKPKSKSDGDTSLNTGDRTTDNAPNPSGEYDVNQVPPSLHPNLVENPALDEAIYTQDATYSIESTKVLIGSEGDTIEADVLSNGGVVNLRPASKDTKVKVNKDKGKLNINPLYKIPKK